MKGYLTNPISMMAGTSFPSVDESLFVHDADRYLEGIFDQIDDQCERKEIECEYSNGILSIASSKGSLVLNRQIPAREMWLSSPISGPSHWEYKDMSTWKHTLSPELLSDRMASELSKVYGLSVKF
ncbi:Frataxin/CyaY like protein [Aduncisulcus paluster]|uniref:Frataxin/CyaY like protein n=1 Tax=Aduncisulcus paluster TaxID=2918883 RepID=A0ABQ5KNH1_9EUKA|nr:Frataxin/CyaY like protein [Aduncisulcus paluster]